MDVTLFIARRLRFKGRIAMVSIAVSFLVMIISVSISSGFRNGIRDGISLLSGDIQLTPVNLNYLDEAAPVERYPSYLTHVEALAGVEAVRPAVYRAGIVKSGEDIYFVKLPKGLTMDVLTECGLMQADGESFSSFVRGISPELIKNTCCAKSYLKGLFLTAGSIYVPQTTEGSHGGYHAEFQVADEKEAEDIKALLERFGINFKVAQRGVNYIVYAKDKDVLLSFLVMLSLTDSALELKKIIEDRELNNFINRGVICEAANLDKTFEAAAKQILAIQKIEEESGLDSLGEPLKEVALSRLNNPTASMSELAELIGISKSCLAHRLRKIMKIGEGE